MRRRLISLLLVLCMVLGMVPMTALADTGENQAPVPGKDISLEMRLNDWYDIDLSEHFTDPEGDVLVYEVSTDGKQWKDADASYAYYPAGTGTQKAFFRAKDGYNNLSQPLMLTAEVEAPPSTVTVTLSISRGIDGFAYCEETSTVMTPETLTVPYFDLALYGLERFYYNPLCYSTHKEGDTEHNNSQEPGTKESAQGIVTLMHVFIYATERFYLGFPEEDCGKGYAYQDDSEWFNKAISWSGHAGSSFMKLWNHGTNLNYYESWEFPLGAKGWGSTSDQIALYGGEKINGHMIMDSGASGTNFSFFTVDGELDADHHSYETTVVQGEKLELTAVRAVANYKAFAADYVGFPGCEVFLCDTTKIQPSMTQANWQKLDGVTGEDGTFSLDTTDLTPGTYYVAAKGTMDNDKGVEVAPALIKVKVTAPHISVETVTLNKTEVELAIGGSEKLSATVLPLNATGRTVHWTSSDESIVTVDRAGTVTGIAKGEAIVTAEADGVEAECKVKVSSLKTVVFNESENSARWPDQTDTITQVTVDGIAVEDFFWRDKNCFVTLDNSLADSDDAFNLVFDGYASYKGYSVWIDGKRIGRVEKGEKKIITGTAKLTSGEAMVAIQGRVGDLIDTRNIYFSADGKFPTAPVLAGGGTGSAKIVQNAVYELDLSEIFKNISTEELTYNVAVDGGKAQTANEAYRYTATESGIHKLVFTAANKYGASPSYTLTLRVVDADAIFETGIQTETGSFDWIAFTDAQMMPIEGAEVAFDRENKIFTVTLPEDIDLSAKITTHYWTTQNSEGLPYFGASEQETTLLNGNSTITNYLYTASNDTASRVLYQVKFVRTLPEDYFTYDVAGFPTNGNPSNGYHVTKVTISGDTGSVSGYSFVGKNNLNVLLGTDTQPDTQIYTLPYGVGSFSGYGAIRLSGGQGKVSITNSSVWGSQKWTVNYKTGNMPALVNQEENAQAVTMAARDTYSLKLAPLFADEDNDALTYQVKLDNGAWQDIEGDTYSFIPDTAQDYVLTFRAFDGYVYSVDTYVVSITATNASTFYDVAVAIPAEASFYCFKSFNEDGTDTYGEALTAEKTSTGYTVKVPVNVSRLSIVVGDARMTVEVSEAENTVNVQKTTFRYETVSGKTADGTVVVKYEDSRVAVGTGNVFYLVSGSGYTFTATPTEEFSDVWTTCTMTNQTVSAETEATVTMELPVYKRVTITVDEDAELNVFNQKGYFKLYPVEPVYSVENDDNTITHIYSDIRQQYYGNGYMYFATKEGYIDKAGYVADYNDYTITWDGETRGSNYRSGEYSQGTAGRGDDSILVNVNRQNHLIMDPGDTYRLRAFRIWEIISTDTENVMLEPQFTYEGYDEDIITMVSANDSLLAEKGRYCGTGGNNWMDVTAIGSGTTFLEVGYEAVHLVTGYVDGSWGGAMGAGENQTWNAVDPYRKALIVVQTDGKAATDVNFGIHCRASNLTPVQTNYYDPNLATTWDAEFDTLYFLGDSGELSFTPSASSGIQSVAVSSDNGVNWDYLTDEDGTYTMDVYRGNNLICITNGNGQTAYQVVRGDKISYEVTLKSDLNSNGAVDPGDTVRVTLNGLHNPVGKISGIYNPGFSHGQRLVYTWDGANIRQSGYYQYNFVGNSWIEATVPTDATGSYSLTDGYINFNVFGDGPGNHRYLTDDGRNINMSAGSSYFTRSILPDIPIYQGGNKITIAETANGTVTADCAAAFGGTVVNLTVTPDAYYKLSSVTVTDADGNPVEVTNMSFTMPETDVTVTAEFVSVGLGHVTGDEELKADDAALIYAFINGTEELTESQRDLADVNGDGFVDTTDAALVYRIVNGTLDAFPKNGKEGE